MTKKKIPNQKIKNHLLDDQIAIIKKEDSYPNFRISFDYYNSTLCEIEELQVSPARKCLMKLKQLGSSNHKTLRDHNIQPTEVHRSGSYRALFSRLTDDVKLYEIDIGSSSRLFYFITEGLIQIVSIKNSHFKY